MFWEDTTCRIPGRYNRLNRKTHDETRQQPNADDMVDFRVFRPCHCILSLYKDDSGLDYNTAWNARHQYTFRMTAEKV